MYRWRLASPCQIRDEQAGACAPTDFIDCPTVPGRVIVYYVAQRQRLAQADGTPVEDMPSGGVAVGSAYGPWIADGQGCIDVTDLNPPPSPDEVFRYFQELPLPELTAQQQPPGNALVGLPVIFYTTDPATQTYTVDIRGFTVTILATARTYTWHTGDGTDLTSTDPGAPYPDQTVTHDYRAGTYTASLTTTWGGTYTVDAGAPADVPGTTTTDGPPVTFTVLQARAVLTDPYD